MSDAQKSPGDIPDKLFFRIGEAASLVGVEPHVLRYWESEFKIRTQRSSTGQRMYRRKDITQFMSIRKLLHEDGFTIAGARKALQDGTAEATTAAKAGSGGANDDRVREALERLNGIRSTVRVLSERVAALGVAGFYESD